MREGLSAFPVVLTTRDEFISMYHGGSSLRAAALALGLTDEEMGRALLEAQFEKRERLNEERKRHRLERQYLRDAPPTDRDKVWCGQCERLVYPGEFMACRDQWCKARVEASGA